jgi:hypothetical protein
VDSDQIERSVPTFGKVKKPWRAKKKAEGMMQEMGMDYWLRRTKEVLERVER